MRAEGKWIIRVFPSYRANSKLKIYNHTCYTPLEIYNLLQVLPKEYTSFLIFKVS